MNDRWLIDKSAFVRLNRSVDADLWLNRMERGLVGATAITQLKLGYSARWGSDWREFFNAPPASLFMPEPMTPGNEDRAIEVQGLLAERGCHRAVKIPDLLIAAVAELKGYIVLHVDEDFELIAEVNGQKVERLRETF